MRILFATDGSSHAAAAQRFLRALPWEAGTAIRVLSVVPRSYPFMAPSVEPAMASWEAMEPLMEEEAELAWDATRLAERELQADGLEVSTAVRSGDPAHEILRELEEWGADLLALGSRGLTGLDRLLLGSVARNVARHASRPVLVARAPGHGLRQAVLATDGSPHSAEAARFAAALPQSPELHWTALHVVRPAVLRSLLPEYRERHGDRATEIGRLQRAEAEQLAEGAAAILRGAGRDGSPAIRDGDPVAEIVECAREHQADLIVAGARGVSPIQALLVGSVADRLLREAHCSVLLVR